MSRDRGPLLGPKKKGEAKKRFSKSNLGYELSSIQPVSLVQLVKKGLISQFPFSVSVTAAGNTLLISLLLAEIDENAVAAGVFIAALQNLAIGICRASLASNSLVIGNLNGKAKIAKNTPEAQIIYRDMGRVLQQGWLYATLLSVGASVFLSLSGNILKLGGVKEEIAKITQTYFLWYIGGGWPLLHSFTDQQLPVAIKSPWLPSVRGVLYGGSVYGLGLLAIKGYFGSYFAGINGVGFGSALAAWFIFLFTKLTHLPPKMRGYGLYTCDTTLTQAKNLLKTLFSIGFKLGIQVAAEWANLMLMSVLIGQMTESEVAAIQPSIQVLTMVALFSLGQAVSIGAVVSNEIGAIKSANESEHKVLDRNLRRKGYGGIALGMIVPITISVIGLARPSLFTGILLNKNASEVERQLANKIMRVNSVGYSVDAFRSISTGPLRGFADINFSTIVSFLLMSLIGVAVQGTSSFALGGDLQTFFWIRNVVTLFAGLLIFARWFFQGDVPPAQKPTLRELHVTNGQSWMAIFRPLKALQQRLTVSEGIQPIVEVVEADIDDPEREDDNRCGNN